MFIMSLLEERKRVIYASDNFVMFEDPNGAYALFRKNYEPTEDDWRKIDEALNILGMQKEGGVSKDKDGLYIQAIKEIA